MLMIYCDTEALLNNIKRHEVEPKAQEELPALERLLAGRDNGYRCIVHTSPVCLVPIIELEIERCCHESRARR